LNLSVLDEEEFDDNRGEIRICKSKKDRQHDDQMKKDKRPNNDLQNITEKTKDRATRTLFRCYGRLSSSCSTSGTRRDTLARNQMISHEWSINMSWALN
jgi:hypothetical protein